MRDALRFNLLRITEFKWLLVFIMLFAVLGMVFLKMGNTRYLIVTPIVAGGIGANSLIIDERYHMNYYVDAMPFSHRNMVNSEYITAVVTTVLSIVLLLILTICMIICFGWTVDPDFMPNGIKNNSDVIYMILFYTAGIALIFNSTMLAGVYHGLNKTLNMGLAFLAIVLASIAIAVAFTGGLKADLTMFAVGIAAFGLSWYTSVRRNERRDI